MTRAQEFGLNVAAAEDVISERCLKCKGRGRQKNGRICFTCEGTGGLQ